MALTIAIGFVVDDAIVVVENIYWHVEEGLPPAVLKGSREIAFTVLSISISLVAAFTGSADGRDHRPDISRIRRHCHRIDCGVGHSLAYPCPDAVFALHEPRFLRARTRLFCNRKRFQFVVVGIPPHA
jgi:hypothetical protein